MRIHRSVFVIGILTMVGLLAFAYSQDKPKPEQAASAKSSGLHDFDFLVGEWQVHHHIKGAGENAPWRDYEGTVRNRPLMEGAANVEEHFIHRATAVDLAVAIRAYDAKTNQWAIWWIDGRQPHLALDPPVKGGFDNGVGTFYSDSLLQGKPVRTRFIWSHITPTSARWEQAYSFDAGETWDTNWIMEFTRAK